ncbi:MAG: rhodanese-like domain-containing protein [Halochromatium sp.]|uniref:rhodanese-like domain-containing protein n=1 Tax=Halochromatium sp. TaxID=2049430 RepID=UPI00397D47F9
MKTVPALLTSVCAIALTLPTIASAYDSELATHIQTNVTGRMDRQYLSDTPPKIDAPDLVEALSKGQDILLLDIRTPEEHGVVSLSHPRALWIPLDALFKSENLDRLPSDQQIAVVCLSGYRAALATGLLRAAGFEDVVFVNGGLAGLVQAFKPSTLAPQAGR